MLNLTGFSYFVLFYSNYYVLSIDFESYIQSADINVNHI